MNGRGYAAFVDGEITSPLMGRSKVRNSIGGVFTVEEGMFRRWEGTGVGRADGYYIELY